MDTVNIRDARTHLSRLFEEVAAGAEIVISKNGVPRAKVVPLDAAKKLRVRAWLAKSVLGGLHHEYSLATAKRSG